MSDTPTGDVHASMSCSEVEQYVSMRERQVLALRRELRGPGSTQLDAVSEVNEALAAIARVEAVARGDTNGAAVLEPASSAAESIHRNTYLHALACMTEQMPDLVDNLRRELISELNTPTGEGTRNHD